MYIITITFQFQFEQFFTMIFFFFFFFFFLHFFNQKHIARDFQRSIVSLPIISPFFLWTIQVFNELQTQHFQKSHLPTSWWCGYGVPLGTQSWQFFLGYCDSKWLNNCPVQFKMKYHQQYVNDISLFELKDNVMMLLNTRNAII